MGLSGGWQTHRILTYFSWALRRWWSRRSPPHTAKILDVIDQLSFLGEGAEGGRGFDKLQDLQTTNPFACFWDVDPPKSPLLRGTWAFSWFHAPLKYSQFCPSLGKVSKAEGVSEGFAICGGVSANYATERESTSSFNHWCKRSAVDGSTKYCGKCP